MAKWHAFARACPRLRRKHSTLTVYAFRQEHSDTLHWGLGCYAEAQEMLAEAIIRICEQEAIDDVEGSVIVTSAPGVALYRDVHVWKWREDDEIKKKRSGPLWKRFQELTYLQNTQLEAPTNKADKLALRCVQDRALELESGLGRAMVRKTPTLLSTRGVFLTDCDSETSSSKKDQ